jgi:hypothetical protein
MRKAGEVILGMVSALALIAYTADSVWEEHRYLGLIPSSIQTAGTLRISGQSDFREGCGAAIFRLSSRTRAAILKEGLAFLQSARQPRDHANDSYGQWQETPVPGSIGHAESTPILLGVSCSKVSGSLERDIFIDLQSPGSYFTTKQAAALLVLPRSELVVFAYWR